MMDTNHVDAGLICDKDFCNELIFDKCNICKSDFCEPCMSDHDCGRSSSSALTSSESYGAFYDDIRERLNETISTAHSVSSMSDTNMPYSTTDEGENVAPIEHSCTAYTLYSSNVCTLSESFFICWTNYS